MTLIKRIDDSEGRVNMNMLFVMDIDGNIVEWMGNDVDTLHFEDEKDLKLFKRANPSSIMCQIKSTNIYPTYMVLMYNHERINIFGKRTLARSYNSDPSIDIEHEELIGLLWEERKYKDKLQRINELKKKYLE